MYFRTQLSFVIRAIEDRENLLWLCMQDLGKGQRGLHNLLDTFTSKAKNGFLKAWLPSGVSEGGRKEGTRGPGIHVFESPDSIVKKEGVSMFVMLMKGKPKHREKEKAFRRRGEKPFL